MIDLHAGRRNARIEHLHELIQILKQIVTEHERMRREGRSRIKICVGYPVTPIIFLIFTIWMTAWSIQSEPVATLAGLATLLLGYILYLLRAKEASLAIDPS